MKIMTVTNSQADSAIMDEKIRDIVYPRFRTKDFETAHTRHNYSHYIQSWIFDSGGPEEEPAEAIGYVRVGISMIYTVWDKHGRAFNMRGFRVPDFDLVREEEQEQDSSKNWFGNISLGLIVIIICLLF